MRIFYIADFDCSSARMSGEASHVRGVVRALAARGCQVRLIANGWTARSGEAVSLVRIPQVKRPGMHAFSFGLFCLPAMAVALLRSRPDLILSRYFTFVLPLVLLARLFRVPMMLEVNSDIRSERRMSGVGRLRNRLEEWMEKQSCKLAGGIVAVSGSVSDSIRERLPGLPVEVEVIPNGVDTQLYFPRDRGHCQEMLGLSRVHRYIAFTGAFQRYQGLPTLIEALHLLKVKGLDVVLLLVGDGPDRSRVEEGVRAYGLESRCKSYGWLPESEASVVIGASEVCVAPYNRLACATTEEQPPGYGASLRGSPLKIYTYLACGRPVVASSFREAGSFVASIGAGLAVPPDDAEALAAAIESVLSDPQAGRMGEAGYREVLARHGWGATVQQILLFARKLAASNAAQCARGPYPPGLQGRPPGIDKSPHIG